MKEKIVCICDYCYIGEEGDKKPCSYLAQYCELAQDGLIEYLCAAESGRCSKLKNGWCPLV